MTKMSWQPDWWREEVHTSAWERVKEALHRDWEQTKRDLHLGGHEMNQGLTDTVRQAAGKEPLPPADRPNPPKVIEDWSDVEYPIGYGYGARHHFGQHHPSWNDQVESTLRSEWEGRKDVRRSWDEVRPLVKYGYEYKA